MGLRLPLAAITAAVLMSTSCTAATTRETGDAPSAVPSSPPATTASPTPNPGVRAEPLALAIDVHRPPLNLTPRLARRVVDGEVSKWSGIGQPGGHLDVRKGPRAQAAIHRNPGVLAVLPASRLRSTVQPVRVGGLDPLRQPARYPLTTRMPTDVPVVTTLTFVGDIMFGRGVAAASPGNPAAALKPMQRRLARADLTIGNLESTLSQAGPPRQGDDSFAADPAVLDGLARAGFDLLSLANNHTGDYGETALLQTLRSIDRSPLQRVGAGRNAREAWRPVVLNRGGVRVGFLAFNAIGETPRATRHAPGVAEVRMQPRTGPLNHRDLSRMTRGVSRLAQRVDVVVVLPHWGDQYTNLPVAAQRTVGKALIDAGADLVIGEHPHVVQGVQLYGGGLIAYSLGNFIFDMDFSVPTQEGVLLELVLWGDVLREARFTPYVIGADFAPRLVKGPRATAILARIWETSGAPFRS